jgi:hypothetical protein
MMGTYSKYVQQAKRLPHEIEAARARGNEEQARRTQEHLERAQRALARRPR